MHPLLRLFFFSACLFARPGGERLSSMTNKITWERDADGIEGYVGTDEAGQWWGRVDIDAESWRDAHNFDREPARSTKPPRRKSAVAKP